VRLKVLGELKELNDLIGTRPRDLPALRIVPQLAMLPSAEMVMKVIMIQSTAK
jgi:hypothetical protein